MRSTTVHVSEDANKLHVSLPAQDAQWIQTPVRQPATMDTAHSHLTPSHTSFYYHYFSSHKTLHFNTLITRLTRWLPCGTISLQSGAPTYGQQMTAHQHGKHTNMQIISRREWSRIIWNWHFHGYLHFYFPITRREINPITPRNLVQQQSIPARPELSGQRKHVQSPWRRTHDTSEHTTQHGVGSTRQSPWKAENLHL